MGIRGRAGCWLAALSLLLVACSGGSEPSADIEESAVEIGDEDAGDEPSGSTDVALDQKDSESEDVVSSDVDDLPPSPVTTLPGDSVEIVLVDSDTGQPMIGTEAPAGPQDFGEVVDRGIEAGLWDELDGLTRVLGFAVGGVALDQVPGADEVIAGEMRELLLRSNQYALSGDYTDDELAELRKWYEVAVPPLEVLEAITSTARSSSFAGTGFRSLAAGCAPVDPAAFSPWAVVEGCYKVYEDVVADVTLRVYYPEWYESEPDLADGPLAAREALIRSIETYSEFAPVGDIDMVFSAVETLEASTIYAVATVDAQWGSASIAGPCPITTFLSAVPRGEQFQQTVAHEVWHCVQRESGYSAGVPASEKWFLEGGATYFSNVVYPAADAENGWAVEFDRSSRTKPLFELGYEAWIWWQYLGGREGPAAVADMHERMEQQGGGGRVAMATYGEEFQRFVVDYMVGVIPDESDGMVPRGVRYRLPKMRVENNDDGRELELPAEPFVAARWFIEYDTQLRVLETDQTTTVGEIAMAKWDDRLSQSAWKEVAPEVRSKCTDQEFYVVVATTHEGSHKAKIRIDKTEQAVCDPCLIGTWDLRLDTFKAMIIAAAGSGMPAGTDFEFDGNYYLEFGDQGDFKQQRNALQIIAGSGGFDVTFTINSFGTGRYTADGENIAVLSVVEEFVNVESSIAIGGGAAFSDSNVLDAGGGGTYACDEKVLSVTTTGFPEITFDRVEKILAPDNTIPT
jgi:hypothetical protein